MRRRDDGCDLSERELYALYGAALHALTTQRCSAPARAALFRAQKKLGAFLAEIDYRRRSVRAPAPAAAALSRRAVRRG